jgi:thioredoxin 1
MQSITTDIFDEFIKSSELPVLVDFWAPWCGPCKMIKPLLDELSVDFSGILKFVELNVDESPEMAQRYDVKSIPALLLFKDGEFSSKIDTAGGFNKRKMFIKIANSLSIPVDVEADISELMSTVQRIREL